MKNLQEKMESFANSSYNSSDETNFMEDTMSKYYDEKLRRQYAKVLQLDHKIVKGAGTSDTKKSNSLMKILIIVGSILALAIAAYFVQSMNNEPEQTYQVATNLDPYYTEIDFSTRGAVTDAAKLVEMVNFYEQKDFAQVATIYTSLESLDIEGNFLHAIGVSLAKNNQLDEAIKVWNILLETEESKFTYHNVSRWFMGRAMIESGMYVDEGKLVISQVTPESKYYNDAQELLKK